MSHRGGNSHVMARGQARPCGEVSPGLEGPQGCRMRMPGKPDGGAQEDEPVRGAGPTDDGDTRLGSG